jgi:hypothetical protein
MHIKTPPLRAPAVLAVIAGAGLAVAGCGSSPKTTTNAVSGSGPKDGIQAAYQFSACMRNHGVSNFPDPVVHSSPGSQSVGIKVTPSITGSPAFKSAQKACASILPAPSPSDIAAQQRQQRQKAAGLLSFARCMRSRGVTRFPDPNGQGRLTLQTVQQAGVDLQAPSILNDARACAPESQGTVTLQAIDQLQSSGT